MKCIDYKPKKYTFYFNSELYPDLVEWRYRDEVDREANFHKTWRPKVSDLIILTKLDRQLKTEIRHELLASILTEDVCPTQKKRLVLFTR